MEQQENDHPQGGKAKFQEDFDDMYMDPDQNDQQDDKNFRDYGDEEFEIKRAKPKQNK